MSNLELFLALGGAGLVAVVARGFWEWMTKTWRDDLENMLKRYESAEELARRLEAVADETQVKKTEIERAAWLVRQSALVPVFRRAEELSNQKQDFIAALLGTLGALGSFIIPLVLVQGGGADVFGIWLVLVPVFGLILIVVCLVWLIVLRERRVKSANDSFEEAFQKP